MKLSSLATLLGLKRTLRARSRSSRQRFRPELAFLETRRLLSTFLWINSAGGNFDNPQNWRDQNGDNGVPGPGDTADILNGGFNVTVSQSTTVDNISRRQRIRQRDT